MTARAQTVTLVVALLMAWPAATMADPYVYVSVLGRVQGSAGDFSNVVATRPGDRLEYQLWMEIADIGTTNSSPESEAARQMTSLVPGVDGINSLKFNLYQPPGEPVQVNFNASTQLADGWSASVDASPGWITARGNGRSDLMNIRPILGPGVHVGVSAYNTHVPVLVATGEAPVAATGSGADSRVKAGDLLPAPISTHFSVYGNINNRMSMHSYVGEADPVLGFKDLLLYVPFATAEAHGHYVVDLGDDLTLDGSGTWSSHTTATFAWDLNGDDVFETAGQHPYLTGDGLSGLGIGQGIHTIRLQVSTADGETGMDSATLTITPEPATMSLLVLGLCAIAARRRVG